MTAPDCPAPHSCLVPDASGADLRHLRLAHLTTGGRFLRVHQRQYGPSEFNRSGRGISRFAPLEDAGHLYVGASQTVAMLETVFHDVHHLAPRIIYAATDLVGWQMSEVRLEEDVALLDLRDPQLDRLGLHREQLVATTPAHYACTREWAGALIERRPGGTAPGGIIWNSRVAELAASGSPLLADLLPGHPSEVAVLYDRHLTGKVLSPAGPTFAGLEDGQGRLLIEQIADHLDAEIH